MQFMQTEQFMQFVREQGRPEHGRPVLSGPPGLVWSLYELRKTPSTERSDQFAQFISIHSVCAFVCVCVCVCVWCMCVCVFARVCLFVPHTNAFHPQPEPSRGGRIWGR